jgi:hypothetical protein
MADDPLDTLSAQVSAEKNLSQPPLHLWHPPLSGDIDIRILRDGTWLHEGSPIRREPLVQLLASILRREEDAEYYLVTPVEKWRIRVDCLPLLAVDFDFSEEGQGRPLLIVTLNTQRCYTVGDAHPLFLPTEPSAEGIPAVQLDHGLAALFARPAWYRLAEIGEETAAGFGVYSGELFFPLTD